MWCLEVAEHMAHRDNIPSRVSLSHIHIWSYVSRFSHPSSGLGPCVKSFQEGIHNSTVKFLSEIISSGGSQVYTFSHRDVAPAAMHMIRYIIKKRCSDSSSRSLERDGTVVRFLLLLRDLDFRFLFSPAFSPANSMCMNECRYESIMHACVEQVPCMHELLSIYIYPAFLGWLHQASILAEKDIEQTACMHDRYQENSYACIAGKPLAFEHFFHTMHAQQLQVWIKNPQAS